MPFYSMCGVTEPCRCTILYLVSISTEVKSARLLTTFAGIIHIVGFFAVIIVLGVMAPKNSVSFVFSQVTNYSGWSDDGVSWLVGLLSAVYPFLGYVFLFQPHLDYLLTLPGMMQHVI